LVYGSMLAALVYSAREREREPILGAEPLPLSAATFALSKLLVHEKPETWLRQPFLEESAEGRRPRGRRLRYAVGELMNCTAWAHGARSASSPCACTHLPRTFSGARRAA